MGARDWAQLGSDLLAALLVGSRLVLQPASVLHGDSLAGLGLGAGALGENGLGNTHDCVAV